MKPKIKYPIIVEGKYDKNTLSQIFDCTVIVTGGFGIFNAKEKQALIRRIAEGGVIVLTDSDGGGRQLRSFVSGILPSDKVKHIYIPKIEGKERRKTKRSTLVIIFEAFGASCTSPAEDIKGASVFTRTSLPIPSTPRVPALEATLLRLSLPSIFGI